MVRIKSSIADISAKRSSGICPASTPSSSSSASPASSNTPSCARRIFRYATRSAGSASKCRMMAIDTTLSAPCSLIPRTPVDPRLLKTLISVVGKRIARPPEVTSITSSFSSAIAAFTSVTPSGNFIAILPLRMTLVKSDRSFCRTSPSDVANTICRSSHSASGASTGIRAAIDTP